MDLSKLDDEQLRMAEQLSKIAKKEPINYEQIDIALKVEKAAIEHKLNPSFVLPMVFGESRLNQSAISHDKNNKPVAYGVMQITPATAKTYKCDDLSNTDKNINCGMRILSDLVSKPKIGNDAYKVIAGYNAGPGTKFLSTGNIQDLEEETLNHMDNVTEFYNGNLPSAVYTNGEQTNIPDRSEAEQQTRPTTTEEVKTEDSGDESPYSGDPFPNPNQENQSDRNVAGAALGATGAVIGAVKAPVINIGKSLYSGGKKIMGALTNANLPPPGDIAKLIAETSGKAQPGSGKLPGEKWSQKVVGNMGPGGESVTEAARNYNIQQGLTPSERSKYGVTYGGIIAPRKVTETRMQAEPQAPVERSPGTLSRMLGTVSGSSPVMGGLAGYGMGYNAQDAYENFQRGNNVDAATSGVGALSSGLSLIPRAAPAAGALTGAIDTQRRLREKDYIGAGTSALGAIAPYAAPFMFGPEVGIPVGVATALGIPIATEMGKYLHNYGKPAESVMKP